LFLLSLLLAHPLSADKLSQAKGIGEATLVIGLVLLVGSLIYTLHRAITYPLVLFRLAWLVLALFRVYTFEWAMAIPFRQPRIEQEMDKWRLELRRAGDALHAVIAEWGAQVHFLYCSGLAILLALFLGRFLANAENALARRVLLVCSLVILLGGFFHHIRLLCMISVARRRA